MTRHMFAGALTPTGFTDFFDHIMPVQSARARYFLKGSSGGGKGTFMKRVADALTHRDHSIELFHCANDAKSLDAIAVADLGLCIMDATAPHSRDPQIPALTDNIIDFAQFLDKGKLANHKSTIENLLADKGVLMRKAMEYFAAVGKINEAEKIAAETALIPAKLGNIAQNILRRGELSSPASNRCLFLSAITPDGPISLADDAFTNCRVCTINTEEQIGTSRLLQMIQQAANAQGIHTESFYSPIDSTQIEYLHLPTEKQVYVATGGIFGYRGKVDESIDLSPCINPAMFNRIKISMEPDNELIYALIEQTTETLHAAKSLHSKIEEIYIQAMDFDRVNEFTENFLLTL